MSLSEREKGIRERRTNQAISNDLMGPSGKLGVIARYLGSPVIYQGNRMSSSRSMDEYLGESYDVYENLDPDKIPTFDERESFLECDGYVFDGLSRGMHLEIKYTSESHKLTVHYKGYPVYMESAGDLYSYAPFPEWEGMIERLYKAAEKKHEEHMGAHKAEMEAEAQERKSSFLQRLRMVWGI